MSSNLLLLMSKRKMLNLNFSAGVLPAGVTLSRASSGTYFDSSGIMQTAATNAPRFDYDPLTLAPRGILIEPSVTNYTKYGNPVSGWSLDSVTNTTDGTLNPAGTLAALVTMPTVAAGNRLLLTSNTPSAGTYVLSVLIKRGNNNYCMYAMDFASPNISTQVNLGSPTGNFQTLGGGWYRFWTVTTQTAAANLMINMGFTGSPNKIAGSYEYFSFVQLEAGSTPTSYVPTSGAAATRAADQLSFTIPAGVNYLTFTFDDNSVQKVSVSAGAYTVPTNLNRPWIKTITGSAT